MINEQQINEALASRNDKSRSQEIKREINAANDFLQKRSSIKPEWMDNFLELNRNNLTQTIIRMISSENGMESSSGYGQGYFNEIIQNASDLHAGDSIDVYAEITEDKYTVRCVYDDKGFTLSNIYAFLNREMSDKTSENGQTGKFGVGIKSFFNFVDHLRIESNIIIDYYIERDIENQKAEGSISINENWNKKSTVFKIEFNRNLSNQNDFNIEKLKYLIDYLNGEKTINPDIFFFSGKDEDIIFDIRALLFMNALKKNQNPVIENIIFRGMVHSVNINCSRTDEFIHNVSSEYKWDVIKYDLTINPDTGDTRRFEYVLFNGSDISFAFPLDSVLNKYNRLYSTYFIKEDSGRIFPMSALINTRKANIHRNDIGSDQNSIDKAYDGIRKCFIDLYGFICSEQIQKLDRISVYISDIFYSLLEQFCDIEDNILENPFRYPLLNTRYLPKLITGETKCFIVNHENTEKYDLTSYSEGNITDELRKSYFEFVERNDVFDLKKHLIENNDTVPGLKRLLNKINNSNRQSDYFYRIVSMINYFDDVSSFIAFVINGIRLEEVSDTAVDQWLINLRNEIGENFKSELFLKLIGRYKIIPAVRFDGSIDNKQLNFRSYLFNDYLIQQDGYLSLLQNQQFERKYSGLKQEMLDNRMTDHGDYKIRIMEPTGKSLGGWDHTTYDYFGFSKNEKSRKYSNPLCLIERLANDSSLSNYVMEMFGGLYLYENWKSQLYMRKNDFAHYHIYTQQIIDLSCLRKVYFNSFSDYAKAISYKYKINESFRNFLHFNCNCSTTTQEMIMSVLPMLLEDACSEKSLLKTEFNSNSVFIMGIEENSNNESNEENRKFIKEMTGYNVHFYRFKSNSRKKVLAYLHSTGLFIKLDSSERNFTRIASSCTNNNDIYIFHDNFEDDIHSALPIVFKSMGIPENTLDILKGYIHNGNSIKSLNYNSRMRNLSKYKVKRSLSIDWADLSQDNLKCIDDNEILYKLLTARGSYDIFCPICADIPVEAFDYDDSNKKKHSRKIIVLENENTETRTEVPYIITVACANCFDKLKNCLSRSEFDGKNLTLVTQIAHGQFEKSRSKRVIELSPVNIAVMKKYKFPKHKI